MDSIIVFAVVVAVLVTGAAVFAIRYTKFNRTAGDHLSKMCHELGIPDFPFDRDAAVRQVLAGTRPSIPRDGQWWVAMGIEQVGYPSRTRLVREDAAPDIGAVHEGIAALFNRFGGAAVAPPHLPESRIVAPMSHIHRDIILARITGHDRPFGAWLVAVPPTIFGAGKR